MPDEIFTSISKDIKQIGTEINRAKDLISAMKEAGEETSKYEADLRDLELRRKRWERMLEARGIK